MTDTNDIDTLSQVETQLRPALAANWLSMVLRKCLTLTGITVALMELHYGRLSPGEKGRKVMEAFACLAAGILPLWTHPKITEIHLHIFQVSPYKFTAAILVASTLLSIISMCWLTTRPIAFVLLLLLNSFLVNEIKWTEAFFASNWLPESRYYEACDNSKNLTVFVTLVSTGLASLFKTPWISVFPLAFVLYLSYTLAFKVEPFLERQTKYKDMLEESEDFAPLHEWNDDHSYSFYATIKQYSWAAWGVYYYFQFM